MIPAQRLPQYDPPSRGADQPRKSERARHATKRRTRRVRRRLQRPVFTVIMLACLVLGAALLYVSLTAHVTSLNFALSRAERQRAALVDEAQRLDDRIARLQSPERLAALAAQLRLHDPHVYAVVRVPEPPKPQPRPSGLALLGTWFSGNTDGVK